MEVTSISLIIPAYGNPEDCGALLSAVLLQSLRPAEVIIVLSDPAVESVNFRHYWTEQFNSLGINFTVVRVNSTAFPGAARNLGLQYATNQWVAFLDVETIPFEYWLDEQATRIEAANAMGSFGLTTYTASSFKQTLVRDAIYGRCTIQTFPGAVMRKDIFDLVGKFIPNIRAAEDTEWMIRAKTMGVKMAERSQEPLIAYNGLKKLGLRGLIRKWRRNYLSSRQLPHLMVQTTIVWLLIYVVSSLIAFNWNAIMAGWQVDSPFYLDHITKIVSLTPIVLYVVFRGCFLPFKRGVPISALFPFRFLLLATVGAILDGVKVTTIIFPRWKGVWPSSW
jgi:glycosyltransferase involved in cell wall biosynthesis